MNNHELPRREFLRMLAGAFSASAIDWNALPPPFRQSKSGQEYDAIIIGSGLGGLSCAAAFARQGFRPLVIEQHDKPGGFATAFSRPGGFRFDVSLHSMTVSERDGVRNLISGFPEIADVEFLPHPTLYRAIYPEHDFRVQQRDPADFVGMLKEYFPGEQAGIDGLFDDMVGLARDVGRISDAKGDVDMSRFTIDFPHLARFHDATWGAMLQARIADPKLKGVLSAQWEYYGLPPSRLSCFYYAIPFLGYLSHGGWYPRGRSQDISNAFVRYIQDHGGTLLLNTRVSAIILKGDAACGVATSDGKTFDARVVISNANPYETFARMINREELLRKYEDAWRQYSVSLSCFQVFLGLKEDLLKKSGVTDSEFFVEPSYDPESSYSAALKGDVERGAFDVTLYDNIDPSYSPAGKNTVNIFALQGYEPWEKFERDYFAGNKEGYRREKERLAKILIDRAEKAVLPGLSRAIEVIEIGTPLTNVRYTGTHRGAIYGWDQTVNNSGPTRVGHSTPVKNLYLTGAWSRPGHGYGAVIPGGLECFAEVMKTW